MNSIPPAPPVTNTALITSGYWQLTNTLPPAELNIFNEEQAKISEEQVKSLVERMNTVGTFYELDPHKFREITLIALTALKRQLITLEQLCSLHILDAAVRDLFTSPAKYENTILSIEGKLKTSPDITQKSSYPKEEAPYRIFQHRYDFIYSIKPEHMEPHTKPLLQLFFNLNEDEWIQFCSILQHAHPSEQSYHAIVVPNQGSWSAYVELIQGFLKMLQTQFLRITHDHGSTYQNRILVPTFTMLQAFIDVRSAASGRASSIQLLPMYCQLSRSDIKYSRLRASEQVPLSLYFPESDVNMRYQWKNPKFKTTLGYCEQEGPFSRVLEAISKALRDIITPTRWRNASLYFAGLAEGHPNNINNKDPSKYKDEDLMPISEILYIGQLNVDKDLANMIYKNEEKKQGKFGHIFHIAPTVERLHPKMKALFFKHMIMLEEDLGLGRSDLLENDHKLYDELKGQL